ncbi:hypothetical protein SYNPS1DRAFT_29849 [Syncephalis pseudoplumigaleata]|uniref:Uncharacterized protein n=1 Tax=Syncephalis pseudoplumigaleata TaxID=1712513 RepID=A0A4P9YYG2_9FUNG|nr:hypothetical protein SYNPS1DRAFT_29849 [Syncephalis pseudoplumigaleata]|eukprot:RKP24381.1 hypothetical protein SYNPS1DRAFT_29849 [Syncephalis pseudoplumigaleata]
MTQEMVLLVHSPAVVSPTPPPESEEDIGSDRERLLKALAASSTDTAASVESARPGLRKRKEAPTHYPFNRVRRHRATREHAPPVLSGGVGSFNGGGGGSHIDDIDDDDTDATVSVADSADNVTSSAESDAPSYTPDDLSLSHALPPMPKQPSIGQPLDVAAIVCGEGVEQLLIHEHHTATATATTAIASHNAGHGMVSSLPAETPYHQHQHPPAPTTTGAGSMKYAMSGRAPRNASFRCEFCGKKYINRAPLVTAAHVLLGMQQPDYLFAYESYLYPMHDITYAENDRINDVDTSIQALN